MQASSAARRVVKESLAGLAIESRRKPEDIRPIGDQVMVLADEPDSRSRQGLHIPESARAGQLGHLRTGTVVAVGMGDMLAGGARGSMFCKIGDRVIYDQASNRVVKLDGVEYLVLREEQHVVCILDVPPLFSL